MLVAVSANEEGLDAPTSPVFGRCPVYVFVNSEDFSATSIQNPAIGASGGAGIQAAQLIIDKGAGAVLSGNVGPNALQVLQASNVPIYTVGGGTVREAVEALNAGELTQVTAPTAGTHSGMPGRGRGGGMGRGGGGGGGRLG